MMNMSDMNIHMNNGMNMMFRNYPIPSPNSISILFDNDKQDKKYTNIICDPNEKISSLIEKYRVKANDHNQKEEFIFNAMKLDPNKTLIEAGLRNGSKIIVIDMRDIKTGGGFKYEIKSNKHIELIPQISIYFNNINEEKAKEFIEKDEMQNLKKELSQTFGNDIEIATNNITIQEKEEGKGHSSGSILLKISGLYKKLISNNKINNIDEFLKERGEEVKIIKDAINCIKNKSFQCIENIKPMAVKFINQDNIEDQEINSKKIKEFLEEKNGINNYNNNEEGINTIFKELSKCVLNQKEELKQEIQSFKKIEKINDYFQRTIEKAFKESIFEFKIIGLVIVDNSKLRSAYEKRKNECENCEIKILFHSTDIKYSGDILTTNFRLSMDNWYGLGIYNTSQFDYAKFYCNRSENFGTIPKIGDTFNVIASEVYYDKTKLKQIYNKDLQIILDYPPKYEELEYLKSKYEKYIVQKNGIHYIEVDGGSGLPINENKEVLYDTGNQKLPKDRFIGKEYCITFNEQILPVYGFTFQRVDYCVIWRDSNFNNSSIWEKDLEQNKDLIQKMTGYNVYTENNTKDALKLIWRKRFNKIILITNVGKNLEGKKFVDKVRKILGFDIMVLFFANDYGHLDWIKNYQNSLFCIDKDTVIKYVMNFNEEGINDIREQVKEFFGVELTKPKNAFYYPLFEKYKNTYNLYSELDCSEYEDFD